jgi:hypothetical protein
VIVADELPTADSGTFELGLVMAGAISAGAYTAGVIDFLLEALDQWEDARRFDPANTPQHKVSIKVITGASAGGMTAALIGSVIQRQVSPIKQSHAEPGAANPFYDAWVSQIDITKLLSTNDLKDSARPVRSALNADVLEQLADRVFTGGTLLPAPRPYFADTVELFLTVTNVAGVPYKIPMVGKSVSHAMRLHKDHVHFRLNGNAAGSIPTSDLAHAKWKDVTTAALASGAFPIGLSAKSLSRLGIDYGQRLNSLPDAAGVTTPILPYWDLIDSDPYHIACIDGGMIDNEPLELARQALAGQHGHNPRDPIHAHRAVLMIDPFPDSFHLTKAKAADVVDISLTNIFAGLVPALKNQARFKLEELQLAVDETVYSRFLIAPIRQEQGVDKTNIACGGLGGFGGFLRREFRDHDFQLGRRNCQRFLQTSFTLPQDNVVMKHWGDADRTRHQTDDGQLPIIPLFGSARDEVAPPTWPTIDEDELRDELEDRMKVRLLRVVRQLLEQAELGGFQRAGADLLVRVLDDNLISFLMSKVLRSLAENGQLVAKPKPIGPSTPVTFGPHH